VEAQSSAVVVNGVQHNVEEEAHFNELVKAEAEHKVAINTTITEVGEEVEDVDLVGKTMISHNETVTLQSTSVLTGR
jgi:hypothetical protein